MFIGKTFFVCVSRSSVLGEMMVKKFNLKIIEEIKKLIRGKTPLSELELDGTVVTERGLE